MKGFANIAAATVCILALAIGAVVPAGRVSGERFMSDARQSYRGADLVVAGQCVNRYISADGSYMSRVEVSEVLAGSADEGGTIQVQGSLELGKQYLLYLGYGQDVHYAEDELSYVQVSQEPFVLSKGIVEYGGLRIGLDEIKRDILELDKVVTMPAAAYYYDDIKGLIEASESVFIGHVRSISPARSTRFRSQAGGSTVEKTAVAMSLDVMAYGSVKGSVKYGESISVVHCTEVCSSMLNGSTLLPNPCVPSAVVPMREGGIYLFFLDADPDPKQEYCFPINPIQGWVGIDGDALQVSGENRALKDYSDLGALVSALNEAER